MSTVPNPQWICLQLLSLPPAPFPKGFISSCVANMQTMRGRTGLKWVNSKRSDFPAMLFLCSPQTAQEHSVTWVQHWTHLWCLALQEAKAQSSTLLWWMQSFAVSQQRCGTTSWSWHSLQNNLYYYYFCTFPLPSSPASQSPQFLRNPGSWYLGQQRTDELMEGGNWVAIVMQHDNKISMVLISTIKGLALILLHFLFCILI